MYFCKYQLSFILCYERMDQWHTSIEGICVFDMDGKFLNTISRPGNARNEIRRMQYWCIDTISKQVIINDSGTHIKRFSYDGTFISSTAIDESLELLDIICNNGKIYAPLPVPNDVADDLARITDDRTGISVLPARNDDQVPPASNLYPTTKIVDPGLESFLHIRRMDNALYKITDDRVDTCGLFEFLNGTSPSKTIETTRYFIIHSVETGPIAAPSEPNAPPQPEYGITAIIFHVYDKSTGKCVRYRREATDRVWNTITMQFNIVGVSHDMIISKATPSGARYILEKVADKIPQSDREMMEILSKRENSALIFHHLR